MRYVYSSMLNAIALLIGLCALYCLSTNTNINIPSKSTWATSQVLLSDQIAKLIIVCINGVLSLCCIWAAVTYHQLTINVHVISVCVVQSVYRLVASCHRCFIKIVILNQCLHCIPSWQRSTISLTSLCRRIFCTLYHRQRPLTRWIKMKTVLMFMEYLNRQSKFAVVLSKRRRENRSHHSIWRLFCLPHLYILRAHIAEQNSVAYVGSYRPIQ